jgi:hypothetical protein
LKKIAINMMKGHEEVSQLLLSFKDKHSVSDVTIIVVEWASNMCGWVVENQDRGIVERYNA